MDGLTNISTIKELMERHGFHFSKALGQNFIVNPSVCPRIAEMGGAVGCGVWCAYRPVGPGGQKGGLC